jgi:hypothetical protein
VQFIPWIQESYPITGIGKDLAHRAIFAAP